MNTLIRIVLVTTSLAGVVMAQGEGKAEGREGPKRNFKYQRGDSSGVVAIPSKITTTFDKLLEKDPTLAALLCTGDSTDVGKHPFRTIEPVCLQGRGAKMVVSMGYPTFAYEVCVSPMTGGLFAQAHMAKTTPAVYWGNDSLPNLAKAFFLVPFGDYEIPVFSVDAPKTYLPLWRALLMARNGMTEEYFDSHVRVLSAYTRELDRDSFHCEYFIVNFYYHVDWARIELMNELLISDGVHRLCDVMDTSAYEKSFETFNAALPPELLAYRDFAVPELRSVDHIISRDQVIKAVESASPLLGFDVNRGLRLSYQGDLTMELWGTIDEKANKCLRSEINLTDGTVSEVTDFPCWVE